jgi:hypothetical protein
MRDSARSLWVVLAAGALGGAAWWWSRRERASGTVELVTVPAHIQLRPPTGALDVVNQVAESLGLREPRGIRNNNPGNIRWIADARRRWRGMVRDDGGGYGVFESAALGVRALALELKLDERRGVNTVRKLIGIWAPATENDTAAYADAVARALGLGVDEPFSISARLVPLMVAIIRHENGKQPYALADLAAWAVLP